MTSFAPRCWVEISLRQIADNFQAVRSVVGPDIEVVPVVKADAYSHGAIEVARVLTGEGASWLAVASVEEGATLRDSGIGCRILTMSDFIPADRPALIEYNLTPVLHSLEALRDWDGMARRSNSPLPYHLKVDSGFGRLGTRAAAIEMAQAIHEAKHARLEGLMTHFASAGDYTSPQTGEQVEQFQATMACLQAKGVQAPYTHMSSSVPIAYGRRETWGNMVRPGLALYGYVPSVLGEAPPLALRVKPALSWKASVLLVKDVAKDAPIGYGALYKAETPMRIAVLSAGYADGVPHRLSNRGQVIANGRLSPILGAVSMDVTTIDASHCPELQPGDTVTLLGREGDAELDAEQIAQTAGTIAYSVLCGIGRRVRRVYIT